MNQETGMLKILIEDADGNSKTAPIDPSSSEITIGRKEGNFIRLKERNVSRHHARIYKGPDEKLYIEPVAARYGLKVNSQKIEGPTEIALGDDIKIGDYHLYIQDANAVDVRKEDENPDQILDIVPQLQPRFVVISSNFAGVEYHITRTKIIIGRNPECDICIQHNSISGSHAEVRRNGRGDFVITDLNSSNGTKVNGIPINEPFRLSSGDTITLGHVIMRYCGPGDFWSLNFGIYDAPRSNALPIIMGVIAISLAVIGLILVLNWRNDNNKPTGPVIDPAVLAEQNQQNIMMGYLMQCGESMQKGEFEQAEELCKKASQIDPKSPLYLAKAEQLKREIAARNALEELRGFLDDNQCRKAIEVTESIEKNTWAYQYMLEHNLKTQANECLETFHYDRATKALDSGDITTAELARDDLKQVNPKSPLLPKLDDAIRDVKHPRGSSGGSDSGAKRGGGSSGGGGSSAPAAASAKDLCKKAVEARSNPCQSVHYYKQALKASDITPVCKKLADKAIAANPNCK